MNESRIGKMRKRGIIGRDNAAGDGEVRDTNACLPRVRRRSTKGLKVNTLASCLESFPRGRAPRLRVGVPRTWLCLQSGKEGWTCTGNYANVH